MKLKRPPTPAKDRYQFAGRLDPNDAQDIARIAFIKQRIKGAWTRNELLRAMIDALMDAWER